MSIISTIAALVSIVGGLVGIISAVSKEPVFTRLWEHQSRIKAQPTLQSSSSLSQPSGRVEPATHTEDQSRQILPSHRLRPGIIYGLISGVLAIIIMLGGQALYEQTYSNSIPILAIIAWVILSIVAGLLPSRASGSLTSAAIAGGILGVFLFLTDSIFGVLFSNIIPKFFFFGILPFTISLVCGLLGRRLHQRLKVPVPLAPRKWPSDNAAQQSQQAPNYPRHVQGKCSTCGASNAPGAKFCSNCGRKL